MRALLQNLLLASGAVAFALLVLELGVRIFVDLRAQQPIPIFGADPADRSQFVAGHSHTYRTSEFQYTITANRYGRRDVEWTPEVIADERGVLFIGDSFALGASVEPEATIANRLEARFAERGSAREVFNFGMLGCGPPTYLHLLEKAIESGFAARTILVGVFVGNDFFASEADPEAWKHRKETEAPPPPKSRLPDSHLLQFLRLRMSHSTRTVGWALTAGRLLGVNVYDTSGSYIFLRRPTPEQERLFERVLGFLGRMQEIATAHGRDLRLAVFPNRIQVENHDELTGSIFDASRPGQRVLEYCRAHGMVCRDLLPHLIQVWEDDGIRLFFPIDRHLTVEGNRVAAEAIGSFLAETTSLP